MVGKPRHIAGAKNAMNKRGILLWEGPFGAYFEVWDGTESGHRSGGIKGSLDYWGEATNTWLWEF